MEEASSSALRNSSYMFLLCQLVYFSSLKKPTQFWCNASKLWCLICGSLLSTHVRINYWPEHITRHNKHRASWQLLYSGTRFGHQFWSYQFLNGLVQGCSLSLKVHVVKCLWVVFAILLFVNWSDHMSAGVLNPAKRQHGVLQKNWHVMVWLWRKWLLFHLPVVLSSPVPDRSVLNYLYRLQVFASTADVLALFATTCRSQSVRTLYRVDRVDTHLPLRLSRLGASPLRALPRGSISPCFHMSDAPCGILSLRAWGRPTGLEYPCGPTREAHYWCFISFERFVIDRKVSGVLMCFASLRVLLASSDRVYICMDACIYILHHFAGPGLSSLHRGFLIFPGVVDWALTTAQLRS